MPIDIYLVLILYMIYHAIHILNLVPPDTKDPIFPTNANLKKIDMYKIN